MDFKDKLRDLRIESGLSQQALADIVHVSRSAIAKYENGGGKPSEETLKLIADYFKVDISYLNDDEKIKKTKRPIVGFIITLVCGVIFVIATVIASIFYNQMKLSASFSDSSKAMAFLVIIIVSLILVGITSLVGYLLMTIKTGKKKLIPTLVSVVPLMVALIIGVTGIVTTRIQYEDYKTFTTEKWLNAENNHDYRGLLIYSFLEQYDINGYSLKETKDLLGTPDQTNEMTLETYPPQYGGVIYIYDLGYYKDYMDPMTFEITFNQNNNVVSYEVVPH
jgi:transcriptional regulator with XRE-family HTH domain